ncbi:protein polyglycylase TTLL10-like, partial [Stegastes partitus]|uniref:Protein polyglycylase TTLL10-like n=1 Tax=Stegastes partitus TaxID=144197 RepID=A0A9Y4NWP4_9TELE
VWLLEMNCNPALHTNCEVLKEVIPSTVVETLDITLEVFNKRRLRQRILPLAGQRDFVLLHDGVLPPGRVPACSQSNTSADFHHKTTKPGQRREQRRCKSGSEGTNVASAAVSEYVSASGEGRRTASPLQRCSHSHRGNKQTVRSDSTGPRVELKPSKCTLHHRLKDVDNEKTQQKTRTIVSPSSAALSGSISVCGSPETPPGPAGPPVCTEEHEGDTEGPGFKRKEEL